MEGRRVRLLRSGTHANSTSVSALHATHSITHDERTQHAHVVLSLAVSDLRHWAADIILLQDVEAVAFGVLERPLAGLGYSGIRVGSSGPGQAVFFKKSEYTLLHVRGCVASAVLGRTPAQVGLGYALLFGNAHIFPPPPPSPPPSPFGASSPESCPPSSSFDTSTSTSVLPSVLFTRHLLIPPPMTPPLPHPCPQVSKGRPVEPGEEDAVHHASLWEELREHDMTAPFATVAVLRRRSTGKPLCVCSAQLSPRGMHPEIAPCTPICSAGRRRRPARAC